MLLLLLGLHPMLPAAGHAAQAARAHLLHS